MAPNEVTRAVAYCFIGLVALLFSVRMWKRARVAAGAFAIPPHWYDVVAIYMSGIAGFAIGIGVRLVIAPFTSGHTRMLFGFVYLFYAVIASAVALYFFLRPRKLLNAPPVVPVLPTPQTPLEEGIDG